MPSASSFACFSGPLVTLRRSAPSPVRSKTPPARAIPGATVTAQNVGHQRGSHPDEQRGRRLHVSGDASRRLPGQSRAAGLQDRAEQGGAARGADAPRELHARDRRRSPRPREVAGVTPLITTENATVGTVIENRRIVELPLNGRNYLSLIALSPNVSARFAGAGQAGDRQGGSRANQQISISGQRREFNYYTLDGVDNTDVNFNTYIFLPSVDALEEFKVQTGIYSAEFGRAAGQVNVVTKSGSNAFHGTVFEFHRNDKFDARPYAFTAAQAAAPKPDFQWHQFGYTAAGPVARNRRVLHVELRGLQGQQDAPEQLHRAHGGDAVGRFLGVRDAAPRSGDLHGRRRRAGRASRFRATAFRPTGSIRPRSSCSSSIRSRTRRARRTTTSPGWIA